MNRCIFTFVFFLMLFSCIAVPLAQPNEKDPANAFVTKVKGLGFLINAIQTSDGYMTISRSIHKGSTFVLREASNSGQRILEKELSIKPYPGYSREFWQITGLAQTVDGYVFVGTQETQGYYGFDYNHHDHGFIFKLNKNGKYEWSKNFRYSKNAPQTFFDSVSSKPDGGFVVIGRQHQPNAIFLVRFTASGVILWKKGIKNFLTDTSYSQRVSDGIIVASGTRILKIDDSGNTVWKQRLDIKDFQISSMGPARSDNGVVIAGNLGNSNQLMLIQLDANGKAVWTETYSLNVGAIASTLLPISDGYLIGGKTLKGEANGILFKINAKRDVVLQKSFGGPGNQSVHSLFTRNGGYVLIGSSSPKGLQKDMLIASLNSNGFVPGCSLVNSLKITKVASPPVTTSKLEIVTERFSLPSIEINITDSQSPTVSMCQ